MSSSPIDALLAKLTSGDAVAAEQVFLAYEPYLRKIVRRRGLATAEGHDGTEADVVWKTEDPGRDNAIALRPRNGVARIIAGRRIVEAEKIIAGLRCIGVRVGDMRAPSGLRRVRTVQCQIDIVVPEALRRAGEQRRPVNAAGAEAAMPARPRPGEAAITAHDVVACRTDPITERLPVANVHLIRVRRLRVVVEQKEVGMRAALRNELIEARNGEERRIPFDRRMSLEIGARRREEEVINGKLSSEPLIEARIEEQAVVIASRTAEDHRLAVAEDVIREAEPRLNGAFERAALAAGREIVG